MPYKIQPYLGASGVVQPQPSQMFTDPAWAQLVKEPYNPMAAFQQQGNMRRGTLTGGPSYSQFLNFGNEQKFAVYKSRPILTAPILPDETQAYRRQLGALEWDSINPFNTVDQVADQAAQVSGGDPLAPLRGAQDFLASKSIDPFGMGSTGAPARAADYALAYPIAIFNALTNQHQNAQAPLPQDDNYYKFHADPRYWQTIKAATPDQLDQLARATVGKYLDPAVNGYFVEQLRHQFTIDREKAAGLTSGNPAVDYQAIKVAAITARVAGLGSGLGLGWTKIPVVGTQAAEFIDPITPAEREHWASLDPQQRGVLLGHYGMLQSAFDMVGALPALAGLPSVIAVARTGGTVAKGIAQAYDWTLRGAGYVATAGLVSATSTWALEAAVPSWSEYLNREIDGARPISSSQLAGVVNAIGYWGTGTYGASNVIRGTARLARYVGDANAVVRMGAAAERGIRYQPVLGLPESTLYNVGHGGARLSEDLMRAGFDGKRLSVSTKAVTLSETINLMRQKPIEIFRSVARGERTGTWLDDLPPEERILAAQDELQASLNTAHPQAELALRVQATAHQPAALFRSDAALQTRRWYNDNARTIDDLVGRRYIEGYGESWIRQLTGAYTEASMRAHVAQVVERLGHDFAPLDHLKGENRWAQVVRAVNAYEFHGLAAELEAVLHEPGVSGDLSREIGKLSVVTARHLFADLADHALTVLRGGDEAAARAEVRALIERTQEAEAWFSNDWRPGEGVGRQIENVPPEALARWIEDVQPSLLVRRGQAKPGSATANEPLNALHAQMAKDGTWDLAFKPVDNETGQFVSYIKAHDGSVFQTPWLDYPLGNVDNIELGNRGMAMAKYDAVFRGFRTWRVAEFQRALLYRSLTSRFDFLSTQIDKFHGNVLTTAREFNVQPQTLGTVGKGVAGIGRSYETALEKAAFDAFGPGPYLTRTGERVAVDWRQEVAQSYRQSLRLNFTAGLTSHMKSRFGPIGANAALLSDIYYIQIRFNLSPVFKVGEIEESLQFNVMAGVNPLGDPQVERLMHTVGVGNDMGPMKEELTYDQTLQGFGGGTGHRLNTAGERQAASYGFYAQRAPKTLAQTQDAAAIQVRVQAFQDRVAANFGDRPPNTPGPNAVYASPRHALEWELANSIDGFGNILPGLEDRVDEITKILSGSLRPDEINALNHVSPELPSADWSLDPAALGGGGKGAPDWVDSATRPEDRGMWHVTTATDAVHAQGLKARTELIAAQWAAEPELMRMIGGNAMRYRDMMIHYLDNGREVSFHPAGGDLTSMSYARLGHPWTGDLYDPFAGKPVAPYQITKVILDGKPIWRRKGTAPANMGLSASRPDRFVSVTTDYAHAATMERRHVLAVMAARNEATVPQIIDHFWEPYEMGGAYPIDSMASAAEQVAKASNLRSQISIKAMQAAQNEEALLAAIDRLLAGSWSAAKVAEFKYEFVKKLDDRLDTPVADTFRPSDRIGFVGDYQSMATVDPAQIGIVQVGARKGAEWHTGPDSFEVQLASNDLWVLDQRILHHPLATDREGLQAQLAQTLREDGTTIPGFQAYHDRVVEALKTWDAAHKPLGELMPETFALTPEADASAIRIGDAASWWPPYVPAGFLYHGTKPTNELSGIQKDGLTSATGNVFWDLPGQPAVAFETAPGQGNMLLRVRESDVTATSVGGGVVVSKGAIPAENLEVWGADDAWHPLMKRVDQVSKLEDVFGTSEHLTKVIKEEGDPAFLKPSAFDKPGVVKRAWETVKNPIPLKEHQAVLFTIEKLRREFPILVDAAGMTGFREVMGELHVAERDWLPFLLEDRRLAGIASGSGHSADFEALMAHAGGENAQGKFDALYASEEWAGLVGLWSIAEKTASDEAFRVHFFNPYRNAIERSLNHPLMGIYPLSWAYKAARVWMQFLFENRMIPGLRLGMSPAVALNSLVRAQNTAFAQSNPGDLETYLGTKGPFGSILMVFNLLLPGDWSTIPFPLTRTIRDAIRGHFDVAHLERNVESLGMFRDARLLVEMGGEARDFVWGPNNPDPNKPAPPWIPHPNVPAARPSTLGKEQVYR